jgi:hypothetical protein
MLLLPPNWTQVYTNVPVIRKKRIMAKMNLKKKQIPLLIWIRII